MDLINSTKQLEIETQWTAKTLTSLERLQCPVWVFDVDNSRVLWCNDSSLAVWDSESKQDLLSREMRSGMSLSVAKRLEQYKTDFTNDDSAQFREIWTLYPNNEPTTFDMVFSCFRLNTGRICMFCEVTSSSASDSEALRSAEALLHTSVNISLYSSNGEPLYRNPAARSSVHSSDSTLAEHFGNAELIHQLQSSESEEVNAVTSVHTVNGEKWHDITARRCLDAMTGEAAWLISEVDVSRLKATEEHAQFLAEHDTLTKLPNRNYVYSYFQTRIDKLLAANKQGALIFIDLDNFKDVNDSLGHDAGDQLLIEVSDRLRNVSSMDDSVARLGCDEFLLLIELCENESQIETTAQEIISTVSQPIVLQGREIQMTPSIGVAMFPGNGLKIQELMRHADLAMYHAKDIGKNNFAYFTSELSEAVDSRISLESEIKSALRNDEFVAYFQPRVDVNTGQILGAEALARWEHPEKGLIPPGVFISACEESGLIAELGRTIFTQSVIAQRSRTEMGIDMRISVNLSPLQFAEDNLDDELIQIVKQHRGNPGKIELEITESVLLGNDKETVEKLHRLVQHGFKISIDDFGTGYSNLAYLHRYPISCLKIDRSFIESLDSAKPIVELIISMAKLFNLLVVAEGVEKPEQLEMLKKYQCQEYQGYLFEKPITYDSFTQLILSEQRNVA